MDPKNKVQEKVELVLADLEAKINQLKEKVEKLCESTDCFESLDQKTNSIDQEAPK
tara:strand:- start:404 stop:571 length:168 start_codon:yes stop_codon:yes gene_type:complete